jgi:hypothetical protein
MLWIVTALAVAGGIVTLFAMLLSRRDSYEDLGAVSSRWIAEHRVDSH